MSTTTILVQTVVTMIGIVVLIMGVRLSPVLALVIGAIYLGLGTGLGFQGTTEAIGGGFGDVMAEVGLLIAFGVLMGSLLSATGVLQRLVEFLVRVLGPKKLPYALSATLAAVFPAIFTDALLVITAPVARSLAGRLGRRDGLAVMGASVVMGLELGIMLVVPGAGMMAIAGVLDISLGTMFLAGVLVAVPASAITMFLYIRLLNLGMWKPGKDQLGPPSADSHQYESDGDEARTWPGHRRNDDAPTGGTGGTAVTRRGLARGGRTPPLLLSISPVLVALVLIGLSAGVSAAGVDSGILAFLGNPLVALFLGLVGAYALSRLVLTGTETEDAIGDGLQQAGAILVLTGVGGSLSRVVSETGLEEILGGMAGVSGGNAVVPLLLCWLIAAIMRTATGSPIAAALTVAGLLGPLAGGLGVDPVLIALAAGAGGIFGLHVNSNFFWMYQTLMGASTSGTFKSCTLVTSMVSVVCLPLILAGTMVL